MSETVRERVKKTGRTGKCTSGSSYRPPRQNGRSEHVRAESSVTATYREPPVIITERMPPSSRWTS